MTADAVTADFHFLAHSYQMDSENVNAKSNGKINRVSGEIISKTHKFEIVCTWRIKHTVSRLFYIITYEKDGAFWDRIDQHYCVGANYEIFWKDVQKEVDESI